MYSIVMLSCMGMLSVGLFFTVAELLAAAFFLVCLILKMSISQYASSTLNIKCREGLDFRNYTTWLARKWMIE